MIERQVEKDRLLRYRALYAIRKGLDWLEDLL